MLILVEIPFVRTFVQQESNQRTSCYPREGAEEGEGTAVFNATPDLATVWPHLSPSPRITDLDLGFYLIHD